MARRLADDAHPQGSRPGRELRGARVAALRHGTHDRVRAHADRRPATRWSTASSSARRRRGTSSRTPSSTSTCCRTPSCSARTTRICSASGSSDRSSLPLLRVARTGRTRRTSASLELTPHFGGLQGADRRPARVREPARDRRTAALATAAPARNVRRVARHWRWSPSSSCDARRSSHVCAPISCRACRTSCAHRSRRSVSFSRRCDSAASRPKRSASGRSTTSIARRTGSRTSSRTCCTSRGRAEAPSMRARAGVDGPRRSRSSRSLARSSRSRRRAGRRSRSISRLTWSCRCSASRSGRCCSTCSTTP